MTQAAWGILDYSFAFWPGCVRICVILPCQFGYPCQLLSGARSCALAPQPGLDNWLHGQRLGEGSYDASAGRLDAPGGLLNFQVRPNFQPVILNPTTGEVVTG
jgi:hypothetical protein